MIVDDKDSAAEAVFMAEAATAVNELQSTSHTLGHLIGEGPDGGVVDASRGRWRDDRDDGNPTQHTKMTDESHSRPDYLDSAWGRRLKVMENLRTTNRLDHQPQRSQGLEVRDLRVPYKFFLTFVDMARPVFPASTHDINGRDCVPLELRVRLIYNHAHEPCHHRIGKKLVAYLFVIDCSICILHYAPGMARRCVPGTDNSVRLII